jgi:hypothetical protein
MDAIQELVEKINSGNFPKDFSHFGGAKLIITDDPKRNFHEGDLVIYSEHASALSWLVIELKRIYSPKLNYSNKYDFYPYIGELIKSSVKANNDLFETMLYVVQKIKEDW